MTDELTASTGISHTVLCEIRSFAQKNNLQKVILFGSRARGTFLPKSDIDLACQGGDFLQFSYDVDEETSTLLEYDFIDLDEPVSESLLDSIRKDGIIIYEKI